MGSRWGRMFQVILTDLLAVQSGKHRHAANLMAVEQRTNWYFMSTSEGYCLTPEMHDRVG